MKSLKHTSFTMILPTYNEESRVRRIVDYYKPFAKIIVVDNFSTDKTVDILQTIGIEVVRHKNNGSIQTKEWMNFITTIIDTEYVLLLACTEFISPPLLALYNEVAIKKEYDLVSNVRDSYTCGELIPLWGGRFKGTDARIERFMNMHTLNLDAIKIHGHFLPNDKNRILYLPREKDHVIAHLRDSDAFSLINKIADYASVEALHRARNGNAITFSKLVLLSLKEFLRFLLLPPSKWNRVAMREIWTRIVMHSIIYWIGWEIRKDRGREYSLKKNEQLWKQLINSK